MDRPPILAVVLCACSSSVSHGDGATGAGSSSHGSTSTTSAGADGDTGTTAAAESSATSGSEVTTSSTAGEGSSSGGSESGGAPSCRLTPSDPIVVDSDEQVIENLHIVASDGPGIVVAGHTGVTIRNVWIEHAGGPGIAIGSGADDLVIDGVAIDHTGAPRSGPNPSDGLVNIDCYDAAGLTIANVRLTRGSSGIYLVECPQARMSFVEGHDFRGPFPRGQLAQFNNSDGAVLEDFSVVNPQASSWPEDNVNVYQSVDVEIRRGLVDGNNSPSGVGVIFDGDLALGLVEDVDAVRMGNGCFSDYAGSDGVVFRRTRCRENICEDQGRGVPLSNALMWAGHPGYTQIRVEDSRYFAACNDNLIWPVESFAVVELDAEDFALREPIAVELCWE
ncbi:MAG: right-handed parallel beta-helix repeat-containing protein [Nannocystaceae bacterium]|nr:right-handed parallel beta-helix repeat-containing protein [Nannocystaceae bacterium]